MLVKWGNDKCIFNVHPPKGLELIEFLLFLAHYISTAGQKKELYTYKVNNPRKSYADVWQDIQLVERSIGRLYGGRFGENGRNGFPDAIRTGDSALAFQTR